MERARGMVSQTNWIAVAESSFDWEREALAFVRDRFPAQEPYRAWSNFEFIASDGSINEVDLLVFTPQGFFLIEIKSRPGRLFGDAGAWTWETDGKRYTYDNPLKAANLKAKKLRSLLERQRACRQRGQIPFIEPLVFCSAPALKLGLRGEAAYGVCLRDQEQLGSNPSPPGIMAAIQHRNCPGLNAYLRGTYDRATLRVVHQAMEQAGIRPSQRLRKVSDYKLDELIGEGVGYQDWKATHTQLSNSQRRVRLYLVRSEAAEDDRLMIERAARREFQLIEALQHPNILRTYGYTDHELGPALLFEYDPKAMRLDHYLAQRQDSLSVDVRLHLIRQIAEVMRFAHDRKVVHRGLCPSSILVSEADPSHPQIKVFNWQVGYRAGTAGGSKEVTATSHVNRLVEDSSTAYLAPEVLADEGIAGEHLDIFSLGAIAFFLFSGAAPAVNGLELSNKLRDTRGLQISAVSDGIPESLQLLIQESTHPVVDERTESVTDWLNGLDEVEQDLKAKEQNLVDNPIQAQQGDLLPGNLKVIKRLGQGACSVALLVERGEAEFVLKVANDPENNDRLKNEIEVLAKLRHQHIVEYQESLEIGNRVAFLMRPVLVDKEKRLIETLGQRLRKEGRLHIDLLQRFGEDLLDVVNYLEEQGYPHRDIKPDNIAVGQVGRGDRLHLVLFDFSLSRVPRDNIRAGTTGYLDPLLPLRKPPGWDLHAERYAAAVTLYELATGKLPKWGDGATDPSHLDCEVTIEAELFDANLRDALTEFFQQVFRREVVERFDNAEAMLRAWRACFEGIEAGILSDHAEVDDAELQARLAHATWDTPLVELGLGIRVTNALDRINVLTVKDLLTEAPRKLNRLRGVGNQTRKEISSAARLLREQLGAPPANGSQVDEGIDSIPADGVDVGKLGVDMLVNRTLRIAVKENNLVRQVLYTLLGLDGPFQQPWLSQADLVEQTGMSPGFVTQWTTKFQSRWSKEPAVTKLRNDLVDMLKRSGGVMAPSELAEALLMARGSDQEEPVRSRRATALLRVAVEVESTMTQPRFVLQRGHDADATARQGQILVATSLELANYAYKLGEVADLLAQEDPLVPPVRAMQWLREQESSPGLEELPEARLLRLAAIASQNAALSSRQEFYPRGMDAVRALRLAQGALYGVKSLTVEQVHDRVSSRYPEAARLPNRPALDGLLQQAELEFVWDLMAGKYISSIGDNLSFTSSSLMSRQPTGRGAVDTEITPEIADARQFEERLQRAIQEGAYQVLLVEPSKYQQTYEELCSRFPVQLMDFEALLIQALRQVAEQAKVQWDLVLRTDALPGNGDWDKLMLLVGRAMPLVEAQLMAAEQTIVLIYPGLLARYGQMTLLERLREAIGRPGGIPGLWIVVPNGQQAVIDGKAVPVLSPGQRSRIPESWLRNEHRARGNGEVNA